MTGLAGDNAPASAPISALIERAMRRAFELAGHGPRRGINPQVGCVILDQAGTVIAQGWHRGAGTAHAEVDALSKLTPGQAVGATAVVSLEPCNHTGRTGPCAAALIEAGVTSVYYSVSDPGEASAGGAERLRTAGVSVIGGVLASDGEALLGDWLRSARLGRPVITVKWASSLDGRAAASDGSSQWITGADARADVHRRRADADAIIVGTGTALADDPSLTARKPDGSLYEHQPVPIIFGERRVPDSAAVFSHPHEPLFFAGHELDEAVGKMHARGIHSVFIEGGPTLASAFIAAGLVDEYLVYLAPTLLGGPRLSIDDIGVASITDQRRLRITSIERLGDDVLIQATPEPPTLPTHPHSAVKEN